MPCGKKHKDKNVTCSKCGRNIVSMRVSFPKRMSKVREHYKKYHHGFGKKKK